MIYVFSSIKVLADVVVCDHWNFPGIKQDPAKHDAELHKTLRRGKLRTKILVQNS